MLCCGDGCRVRQNSVLNPAFVYSEKRTRSNLNKVFQDNFVYEAVPDGNYSVVYFKRIEFGVL